MKIKSTVWHWLAAGSLCAGLLCGMGLEGNAQVGAPITDGQFVTAIVLVLAAVLFMRLGFAAQDAEDKAAKPPYGRIDRIHARPTEVTHDEDSYCL